MTAVRINNSQIENELNNNSTVNEVMNLILDSVIKEEEVITGIEVNGKELSFEEEELLMPRTIGQFDEINFTVKTSLELTFEALESCSTYIDVVTAKIQQLSSLYQENKTTEANERFAEVIEILDLFVQLMSKIHRTMRTHFKEKISNNQTIQNLEIHLLSVLKALLPAKEKEDIIMLCDLLEYELIDNLTQWKIKAIPELKSLGQ